MKSCKSFVSASLLAVSAAVALGGASAVSTVTPSNLSVGTTIEVQGAGFGGGASKFKAPTAWLTVGSDTHKIPLKVDAKTASDVDFHATLAALRKGDHGAATLHVLPKVKHAAEIDSTGLTLTVELPSITSLSAASGKHGDVITITGRYFGSKKRQLRFTGTLGGKALAVAVRTKTWSDGSITFVVPRRKLPHGVSSLPGALEVVNDAGVSNTSSFTYDG